VLGLASSGAHSNGYSLIRKVIEIAKPELEADFHGRKLKDVIMEPTRIYVKSLLALMEKRAGLVKGMAHITGGGLLENVPRVLADNVTAVLKKDAWQMPPLFQWLQQAGNVDAQEMYRVFNCGIGMVVIVAAEDAAMAAEQLRSTGETVYNLGTIEARAEGQAQTVVV
jgi:phosphoribosylformylglycinamidine cyclo-ligase